MSISPSVFMDKEELGYKCKMYRLDQLGLSQINMCEKLDCSQSAISLFENGKLNSLDLFLGYYNMGMKIEGDI